MVPAGAHATPVDRTQSRVIDNAVAPHDPIPLDCGMSIGGRTKDSKGNAATRQP